MIMSMTGYGCAEGEFGGMKLSAELKSVNNRYLDTSVRLPRSFLFAEESLKSVVSESVTRGKVDVFITVDSSGADTFSIVVNKPLLESYIETLRGISDQYGLAFNLDAVEVSRLPDVLTVEKQEADRDAIAKALCDVLSEAVHSFNEMRAREGAKLEEDVLDRLVIIEGYVTRIEEASPETVSAYRAKLEAKIREVVGQTGIDETRILTEAAIFADKVAVDEETVRLRSHIAQMRQMLAAGSPVGRKLDFLIQEFNREANTIGSKCSDKEIASIIVELKSEIEKIREQIQNIE
ncbi:MAG: YicC family protein [Oscillospiraceae bacterium]|nr:YicC family protein [Oscillospiraceae bacterium]